MFTGRGLSICCDPGHHDPSDLTSSISLNSAYVTQELSATWGEPAGADGGELEGWLNQTYTELQLFGWQRFIGVFRVGVAQWLEHLTANQKVAGSSITGRRGGKLEPSSGVEKREKEPGKERRELGPRS